MELYNRINNFVSSAKASAIAFSWGLAEAMFFFIIPDVFFIFSGLISPWRAIRHGIYSVGGTLLGGSIMYLLAARFPLKLTNFLSSLPNISEKMIILVQNNLTHDGLKALFKAPLMGIPYKIYAVEVGILQLDFIKFLFITVPARLERILLLSIVAAMLGWLFRKNIQNNTKTWVMGYFISWVIFYIVYSYKISINY